MPKSRFLRHADTADWVGGPYGSPTAACVAIDASELGALLATYLELADVYAVRALNLNSKHKEQKITPFPSFQLLLLCLR